MIFSKQFLVGSLEWLGIREKAMFCVAFLFSITFSAQGYQIPEKPKFQTSVYDYIGLLSSSQKNKLRKQTSSLFRYHIYSNCGGYYCFN
jgi:uncharacterized protein